MDPIAVFEPVYSSNSFWLYTGLVLSVLLWVGFAAVLAQKSNRSQYQRRMLLALLLFLAGITFSGMTLFSGWAVLRTGKVSIYADYMEHGSKRYGYDQIQQVYMQDDRQTSMINPNLVKKQSQLLFVELKAGKLIVFSSEDYETSRIFDALRNAFEAYRKQ